MEQGGGAPGGGCPYALTRHTSNHDIIEECVAVQEGHLNRPDIEGGPVGGGAPGYYYTCTTNQKNSNGGNRLNHSRYDDF